MSNSMPVAYWYKWRRQRLLRSWPIQRRLDDFRELKLLYGKYQTLEPGTLGDLDPPLPGRGAVTWTDDKRDRMVVFTDTVVSEHTTMKRRGYVTLVEGPKLGALFIRR